MQTLAPNRTSWYITFGTYGTRLHGGKAPTVDKENNRLGQPFVQADEALLLQNLQRLRFPAVRLTVTQRVHIEEVLPELSERGSWNYRIGAAQEDHVHLLCDVKSEIHGDRVRRLVKRWLGQELSKIWPLPAGARWWAIEGSNKAIHDSGYLHNAFRYIKRQRTKSPVATES